MDRPLGPAELVSNEALASFSDGMWVGAENLLTKAVRALRSGDGGRAERLVSRAVALPFDDHEGSAPAAMVAHFMLFSVVTDAFEDCEEGDQRWLEPAVDLLGSVQDYGRLDLRDVLAEIDEDYDVTPEEHGRIRAATRDVPQAPVLQDQGDLSPAELGERVMAILRVYIAYEDEVGSPQA